MYVLEELGHDLMCHVKKDKVLKMLLQRKNKSSTRNKKMA